MTNIPSSILNNQYQQHRIANINNATLQIKQHKIANTNNTKWQIENINNIKLQISNIFRHG